MALTPVEIRHMRPPKTLLGGYRRDPTERLFDEIVGSFEDVWRERADLADKVEALETDLVRFRELETLLRTTLVSAEQASAQMRDQARQEAELILGKAHAEAREIQRRAYSDNERLTHVSRRVRAQLVEALSAFDDPKPEDAAEEVEPEATQESDSGEERSWYGVPDADAA